jgi:hypothetical protein
VSASVLLSCFTSTKEQILLYSYKSTDTDAYAAAVINVSRSNVSHNAQVLQFACFTRSKVLILTVTCLQKKNAQDGIAAFEQGSQVHILVYAALRY